MCGIAGFYLYNSQPQATEKLRRMAEALHHRGPDDSGVYLRGNLGLAHTRLSIIDLEGGHQPLFDDDRGLALVANGEIYNYVELREALIAKGHRFNTHSDCETILQAYAGQPRDFLGTLRGMFAFALHDEREGTLTLARDRLGIKPLFYLEMADGIAFASEIKALLTLLPTPPVIRPEALIQYLQNQFNTGEETIFAGIRRLPPGTAMRINAAGNIERWRYWSALDVEPRQCDFETAAREFDELMDSAMHEHMRSDVPFGLFLSGGVDSAILLAMLDRYQDKPIRSFSVGFSGVRMDDELDDAERIARQFRTEHTPLKLDQASVFRRLVHTVWAADDLMRDYACLPTDILAQHASQELKVVFSGEGGDEVFAGYGRYRPSPLQRWAKNLIRPGSGGFRTRGHWRKPWPNRVFGAELQAAQAAVRAPIIAAWQETPKSWDDVQRSQYVDLTTALPDNLLVKADRTLMGFGLEGRVPFLDHRIVEFGLSLPTALKIQSGQGKLFLKRWAEQYLPKDHLYRKKRGFHVPVNVWLQGDFLAALTEKLPRNPAICQWFRVEGVKQMLAAQAAGKDASREIWGLMQFAIWHRLFVEEPGRVPAPEEDPLDWIS
jgi:asparagine synthase (glutamine-hydrolysing)